MAVTWAVMPSVDPKYYPRMVERYRYHYLSKDHELVLFAGVREMLLELQHDAYFLAVATGKSRVGLNRSMNAVGLLSLFDATRCADETFSKPGLVGLWTKADAQTHFDQFKASELLKK